MWDGFFRLPIELAAGAGTMGSVALGGGSAAAEAADDMLSATMQVRRIQPPHWTTHRIRRSTTHRIRQHMVSDTVSDAGNGNTWYQTLSVMLEMVVSTDGRVVALYATITHRAGM